MRRRLLLWALAFAAPLTGCGEDPPKPANTTVSGTIKEIKKVSHCSTWWGCTDSYELWLTADSGERWYGSSNPDRVEENDLRSIVGERVTFRCYRDHPYTSCHGLHGLEWNGRELIKPAK